MAKLIINLYSSIRPKSRHFRQVEINKCVVKTKAREFPFNRFIHIKLNRINCFLKLHITLLISKSLGVEI